jgi:hypothetical protein
VVGHVHAVDELGLSGEVDVVGAGLGARGHERLAVAQVGPDGGDHDARPVGDVLERDVVIDVGREERQVAERLVDGHEVLTDALELGRVAPGQAPPQPLRRMPGEVLRGEAAGEARGAEENEVELPVGRGIGA